MSPLFAESNQIYLPDIGKWVLTKKMEPAIWLSKKVDNKSLYEPINVVIIDKTSKTEYIAVSTIEKYCSVVNYKKRFGHSYGYYAKLDSQIIEQLPKQWRTAFSDNVMWKENNHGRLFGPYKWNHSYIFCGSFARERFHFFALIHHEYVSYKEAVNDFCRRMISMNGFKEVGIIELDNRIDSNDITTGDHDGKVIVIEK